MSGRSFVDTNLWVYLFSDSESVDDQNKKSVVVSLLRKSSEIVVSGQVLAELVNVFLKKTAFSYEKIQLIVHEIIETVEVVPVDEQDISYALDIAERYKLSWYDALIVASAVSSEADILYTEDMQNALQIDKSIRITNPFVS
ncbi:MAG TPA: PIN domain-containing protein [Spirochaetota bacterium]|nr:PIN domain-containing protein [Spirochaetota bacterium]